MYQFLKRSTALLCSKTCRDNIYKCFSCEISTVGLSTRLKAPHMKSHNPLLHSKFCSQAGEDYVSEEDIQFISEGDTELERKLRVIILETDVMRQDGKSVPPLKFMKRVHWQELLALQTRTARSKYLTFLFKTQKKVENTLAKKAEQRTIRESRPKIEYPDDGTIHYHLGANNMFLRVYETTMNQMYNNKLMQAMQFGQKLIIDCGFHNNMNKIENTNCAKQLMLLFAENRMHDDPFDLHFCNLKKDNRLHEILHKFIPTMYDPEFPLNIHEQCYLDLFPRDKLVYLTPHCREEMTEFDHDTLYIVGAIVDKTNNSPLTLAKAKEQRIRMAKLPLDRYLYWGSGSGKSLTLNQMIAILLDLHHTGDWSHSLRHVPRRKIIHSDEMQSVREIPERLSNDLPVSKQLIRAAKRSNGVGYGRMQDGFKSRWRPNVNYEDGRRKEPKVDLDRILESDR